jgi:hypothetical protein
MDSLLVWEDPAPETVAHDIEAFLRQLDGPGCIFLRGHDRSRTRGYVTLLHGNEPSGAMALHRWLLSGEKPAVNMLCILGSVMTSLTAPLFNFRMLSGQRDLNRCFRPPFEDAQGQLAAAILEVLSLHKCEAIIDVHNTSGSGPAFGVSTRIDRAHEALVSLYTRRLIQTDLSMGSLMETSTPDLPVVTVECGGRMDEEAHALAWEGLKRYFRYKGTFDEGGGYASMEILRNPVRLEVDASINLQYAPCRDFDAELTLLPDVERYNFGVVSPDTLLGWVGSRGLDIFRCQNKRGESLLGQVIREEDGMLYPVRPLRLFMVTTNADIALSDCLFYAVAEDGSELMAV